MIERVRYIGLSGVLAIALAGTAAAQSAPATPPLQILSAPDQIHACLCAEQALTQQGDDVSKRRSTYDRMKQELSALDSEVETKRPQVNVNDPNAVSSFRQLLEKRDATQRSLDGSETPQLASAVDKYNASVAGFNRDCANKSYDATVLAQVRPTLDCPKP